MGDGATFPRVKTFVDETLTAADINAEFDNILDNLEPQGVGDYSDTVAEMKAETNPGALGSESQATSLAGELERIRFALRRALGVDQWYIAPDSSLNEIAAVVDFPLNRLVSGLEDATTNQPIFLKADGAGNGNSISLDGAATNFIYFIDGVQFTISSDVTLSGIVQAPSTNNTALVNDTDLAGAEATKVIGENGTVLTIDNVGTEITNRVGQFAAFKINNGVDDEFFVAFIKSTTELTKIRRGYLFDENSAAVDRITISNNDTITLLQLSYIFANTAGALDTTTQNLIVAKDEPTGATSGQYWFDLANNKWKKHNGTAFADADATLVGLVACDDTDCLGSRSNEFFANYSQLNTVELEFVSVTAVQATERGQQINVAGTRVNFDEDLPEWDITLDLVSGFSEASSTTYYVYLDEQGDTHLEPTPPYDRTYDLEGFYHPHKLWRAVGQIDNDGSSDFDASTILRFGAVKRSQMESLNLFISDSSGSFTSSSATFVDITNLEKVAVLSGVQPVSISLIGDGAGASAYVRVTLGTSGATSNLASLQVLRNGVALNDIYSLQVVDSDTTNSQGVGVPPSSVQFVDMQPLGGKVTYKLQGKTANVADIIGVINCRLMIREM